MFTFVLDGPLSSVKSRFHCIISDEKNVYFITLYIKQVLLKCISTYNIRANGTTGLHYGIS
jgi:hypothetical protein